MSVPPIALMASGISRLSAHFAKVFFKAVTKGAPDLISTGLDQRRTDTTMKHVGQSAQLAEVSFRMSVSSTPPDPRDDTKPDRWCDQTTIA